MKYILYVLVVVILTACNNKTSHQDKYVENIPVNVKKCIKARLSYFFNENAEYIILSNEKAIVSDINKILFNKNNIFILDQRQQNILRFDITGKFLNYCGIPGKGSGELFYPNDFNLHKNTVKVLCGGSFKIVNYNYDGTFINKEQIQTKALSFDFLDNTIYLYRGYNADGGKSYRLYSFNAKKINKYLAVSTAKIPPIEISTKNFNHVGSVLHMNEPLNDTIYEINTEGVFPKYYIDFLDYKITNDILTLNNEFNILKELNSGRYAQISSYFENEKYLIFKFFLKNKSFVFLKNKQKNKSFLAKSFVNDLNYFPFGEPVALTLDDRLIVKVEAYNIIERENYLINNKIKDNAKMQEFYKLSDQITDISNPVLFVYKLKF